MTFVLDDNKTCDKKEAEEVWITRDQSFLKKRQCTIQLTVFADGKRFPPIIIFRGQVLRINAAEKKNSIDALKLFFSLKLGVTGKIIKSLVSEDWVNNFLNPATPGSTLFADIDRDQQTSSVKHLLPIKNKKVLINIPGGATSRVQPLDVVLNKPFKNLVWELFEKHIDENFESYVEGTLSVTKRRILTTKWVADAWG